MIADIKGKGEILFADYVTVPYKLAVIGGDKAVTELDTETVTIENRVSKGKIIKGLEGVARVVALKHKTEYPAGGQQLKF